MTLKDRERIKRYRKIFQDQLQEATDEEILSYLNTNRKIKAAIDRQINALVQWRKDLESGKERL